LETAISPDWAARDVGQTDPVRAVLEVRRTVRPGTFGRAAILDVVLTALGPAVSALMGRAAGLHISPGWSWPCCKAHFRGHCPESSSSLPESS
jgi:hypothetical protein